MKSTALFLILLATSGLHAIDKSDFDLPGPQNSSSPKALSKSSIYDYLQASNQQLEVTLLPGGYFTIGSNEGTSDSKLDDDCGVTYGHPYAMTSFPVLAVDGIWHRLDDYFESTSLSQEGDTLSLIARNETVAIRFSLALATNVIQFNYEAENPDNLSHTVALGLLLDPALGKWGDGSLFYDEHYIENETFFDQNNVPAALHFREREGKTHGMEMTLDLAPTAPQSVFLVNWNPNYDMSMTGEEFRMDTQLRDGQLRLYWGEHELSPGQTSVSGTILTLEQPAFEGDVFCRWELPRALTLTDGRLFPRDISSYLEITNLTNRDMNDISIQLSTSPELSATATRTTSLSNGQTLLQPLDLTSNIVYEDRTASAKVTLSRNGMVLDELERRLLVPATPTSDTGLAVEIDTLHSTDGGQIQMSFRVTNKEKEYLITDLSPENVFLYENDERVVEFDLGKDESGLNSADIVFVLDVTGSMGDEIDEVKDNIIEFGDSLSAKGIDYRLGMVTFLDEIGSIYPFTDNVDLFRNQVAQQRATGGGDGPENSLDALHEAAGFDFRDNTNRILIWITDASYHEQDGVTSRKKQEVVDELLANGITVHGVGRNEYQTTFFNPITITTGGGFFNIQGNFRDVLLEISRFETSTQYLLSFDSHMDAGAEIKLQIRYAGLGGAAIAQSRQALSKAPPKRLSFYPNPFNPEITFQVNQENAIAGEITIYNLLGQEVKSFVLTNRPSQTVTWNASNDPGRAVGSGLFIVRALWKDVAGEKHSETARIMYLK